jgi:diguanylate cyclase (GGDEF)-like protein
MKNNILIVDDSPLIRKQVLDTLQPAQLFDNYHEANNGFSAIKVLSQEEISMIVCDVMMPGMDGFKLLEFISMEKRLEHIKVIMLSGNLGVLDRIRGLENGAVDYITKPFHPQELILRVKMLLKMNRLQNDLKAKITELERVSIIDNLTGLFNSRYLYEALVREYNRCERFNLKLSLIMLDVDYFKEINDTYGHQRGDTVLREIGRVLQSILRGYDFAVRYGGDEFMIVLSQNTVIGAHIVAERIRKVIEESPLLREISGDRRITVSVGVASYPDDTVEGSEALISMADNALYKAKREGRNRVASYLKGVVSI